MSIVNWLEFYKREVSYEEHVSIRTVSFCPMSFVRGLLFAEPADVLSTLDKNHPRLMLKDKDLQQLKEQYAADKTLQKCLRDVLDEADGYINARMLTYDKIGPRLLHVSRSCLHRIYALALA